jgi:hypothetical protein
VDKISAAAMIANDWGFYRDKLTEGITKDYNRRLDKDPNFTQTPEAKQMIQAVEALGKTDDKGNFMEKGTDGQIVNKGNFVRDVMFQPAFQSYHQEEMSKKNLATFDQTIAEKVRTGEMKPEEGAMLVHPRTEREDKPYASAGGGVVYDTKTGKPTFVKPNAPREPRAAKIVTGEDEKGQVTYNVDTKEKEYIGGAKPKGGAKDPAKEAERQAIRDKIMGKTASAKNYKTANDVKKDFQAGKLTWDQAARILRDTFGMQ